MSVCESSHSQQEEQEDVKEEEAEVIITLENIDVKNQSRPLNSPRSIEACQREGIDPFELFELTEKQLLDRFEAQRQSARNLTLDQYRDFLILNRQKKLEIARRMREAISREVPKKPQSMLNYYPSQDNSAIRESDSRQTAGVHVVEEEIIEKIKVKQKKEIASMLTNEIRLEEIKKKSAEKQAKILEKEKMRDHMVALRRQQGEVKQKKIQEKLAQKEKIDEMRASKVGVHIEEKEKAYQIMVIEKEAIRKSLAEQKEMLLQSKKLRFEDQMRRNEQKQQEEFEIRRQNLDRRQQNRHLLMSSVFDQKQREKMIKWQNDDARLMHVRSQEIMKCDQARLHYNLKEMENNAKQAELIRLKNSISGHLQEIGMRKAESVQRNLDRQEQERWEKTSSYFSRLESGIPRRLGSVEGSEYSQMGGNTSRYSVFKSSQKGQPVGFSDRSQSARSMKNSIVDVQQQTIRENLTHVLDVRADHVREMQMLSQKQRGALQELKTLQVLNNQKMVEKKRELVMQKNIQKIEAVKTKLEQREQERIRLTHIRNDMAKMANNQKQQLNEQFQKRQNNGNIDLQHLAQIYDIDPQSVHQ